MPVELSVRQPSVDLLDIMSLVAKHPSLQVSNATERFGTTTSSVNWKPFVIGLLAPDNPVNFIPWQRIKREIPLAGLPKLINKAKNGAKFIAKGAKPGDPKASGLTHDIVDKKIPIDDLRQSLYDSWMKVTGTPPTDAQLAFPLGQAAIESGSGLNRDTKTFNNSLIARNFNFSSHETGMATKSYIISYDSNSDSVTYYSGPKKGQTEKRDGGLTSSRNGVMYYAPRAENAAFYKTVDSSSKKFVSLDSDVTNGPLTLRAFGSFDSLQEGTDTYMSYVIKTFPKVLTAKTPFEWNEALRYKCHLFH